MLHACRPISVENSVCGRQAINMCWPAQNKTLFDRILEHGAIISQFPFNFPGNKQSVAIRNRIVAGMTLGTVVVEANLTSGSLFTAKSSLSRAGLTPRAAKAATISSRRARSSAKARRIS